MTCQAQDPCQQVPGGNASLLQLGMTPGGRPFPESIDSNTLRFHQGSRGPSAQEQKAVLTSIIQATLDLIGDEDDILSEFGSVSSGNRCRDQ